MVLLVRTHIAAHYPPGQKLPLARGSHRRVARALADRLHLTEQSVSTALRTLDSLGVIQMTGGPRVLGPYELHDDDIALDATVRQRILSGYYRFGQALPTGLLGEEFLLTAEQVTRALRRLVRDDWVRRDPRGPYGPGYYICHGIPPHTPAVRRLVSGGVR
ncbi:GntR family transcriptional regulator [Streptomyces sp. NPDC058290]|uniref:GntR family transcriptional regulator n=1 Tax=Streptomyces sp. NPDC058290 TaxID=3346426 RepID=UPI0036E8E497